MNTTTVSRSNPIVKRALALTFPTYKGRKVRVAAYRGPQSLDLNWSGGSRDEVALIELGSGRVADLRVGAPWTHNGVVDQPSNTILAVHSMFCGQDAGVTFYVRGGAAIEDQRAVALLTA